MVVNWEKLVREKDQKKIDVNGQTIVVNPIDWYTDEKIMSSFIRVNPQTKQAEVDTAGYQLNLMRKFIVDCPGDHILKNLDPKIKEQIIEAITGKKEKKN